jgi:hydrophobic/amphiphilic exporter-1 (mainly G- bacteria), HAE1 family
MNLPEFSIKRPVTVIMIVLIMILMGAVSLFKLPVELYPNTSFGEISIVTYVRGQIPPAEVEQQVTRLVEDAVSTVSFLKQVLSISKEGESTVVLQFEPGTDMDFAALEVREKFSRIKNKLPKSIEKPVIAQFKQSDVPVLVYSAISNVRTPEEVRTIIDEQVKERFKRVSGVANVQVYGGRERKILVEIDQQKVVAYGLTMSEITGSLGANNLNLLSGEVDRTDVKLLVRMIGEFDNIDQIKNLGIRRTEYGSILRLKDVATVKDAYMDPKGFARHDEEDIVSIAIQKENQDNTITVVHDLLAETELIRKELPKDIRLIATSNQAIFIERAIESLKGSLMQGSALIFLVFFIFLFRLNKFQLIAVFAAILATIFAKGILLYILFFGILTLVLVRAKLRPVIIVTLSIPISVVATFFYMRMSGLSLNIMTLFGLALGVGMLVDNSIVVFDNILKKRENGEPIREAAIHGSQELLLAIIASTLTTIIVFLPLIFMSKEIQLLYSSMASTVIVSLILSLFCAITIVPLVSSREVFAKHMVQTSKAEGDWVQKLYPYEKRVLFKTLKKIGWVLIGAVCVVLVSGYFMSKMPLEYMGSTEQSKFTIFIEMPTGTRLDISNEITKKVEKIALAVPEAETVTARVEGWSCKVYVELVSATERDRSMQEVIDSMRPQVKRFPPAFIYFEEQNQVGTKELTLEVFGYNYKVLRQLAIGIANRLESIPGLADMKIRMREGRPEMGIHVDKHQAASINITSQDVGDQVHASMRGLRATMFHEEGREVETITRLQEKYRKTFRDVYKMVISGPEGKPHLLEQMANFKFDLGPSEIWRKNKDRMIQVSASIGKIPLSEAAELVHEALADLDFPEDYYYRIGGDYDNLLKMGKEMTYVRLGVVILIYLVLASLFESFSQPILIMIAIPLALGGAILALYMGPKTIGMGALLGMMMLCGIVVNHSIMLMDRINFYERIKRAGHLKAVIMANRDRLRPILLTTCTTVLGLTPMAIDRSESANLWAPLASTVIGGLLCSMFLTLLVVPSFFLTFMAVADFLKHLPVWIRERLGRVKSSPKIEVKS